MTTQNTIHAYGITNCDTVKKARTWLTEQGLDYTFHDFKKEGATAYQLLRWMQATGWDKVTNRQGTTWRKLDAALQASVTDAPSAARVLQAHVSAIKRPVVEWTDGRTTLGFKAEDWEASLK